MRVIADSSMTDAADARRRSGTRRHCADEKDTVVGLSSAATTPPPSPPPGPEVAFNTGAQRKCDLSPPPLPAPEQRRRIDSSKRWEAISMKSGGRFWDHTQGRHGSGDRKSSRKDNGEPQSTSCCQLR